MLIGQNLPVAPPNVGPHTDRIAYGLGAFDPNDPDSHNVGLYDDAFAATFIRPLGAGGSEGRAWAGTRDDGFYLDEKAIFDVINLAGILGRVGPGRGRLRRLQPQRHRARDPDQQADRHRPAAGAQRHARATTPCSASGSRPAAARAARSRRDGADMAVRALGPGGPRRRCRWSTPA